MAALPTVYPAFDFKGVIPTREDAGRFMVVCKAPTLLHKQARWILGDVDVVATGNEVLNWANHNL